MARDGLGSSAALGLSRWYVEKLMSTGAIIDGLDLVASRGWATRSLSIGSFIIACWLTCHTSVISIGADPADTLPDGKSG